MTVIRKVKCDNPKCDIEGVAEWWAARGDKHQPPYGWLKLDGYFQGTGPAIAVEVCSIDCLEEAVFAAWQDQQDH
jgi:hypothetical protein